MQEMLTETKRQTAALEKLIAQYEERLTRIENKPDGTA
jgi:BMFP domain-containing protein YqiC